MTLDRDNQNSREWHLRRYFHKRPSNDEAIRLIVIGIFFILLAALLKTSSMTIDSGLFLLLMGSGIAMGFVGGQKLVENKKLLRDISQCSDQEVEAWFQESLRRVVDQSKSALNVLEQEVATNPLVIVAPTLETIDGVDPSELAFRKGADNQPDSAPTR